MFKYFIRYNVYTHGKPPAETTSEELTTTHMDEQGLKKILETKHAAQVTLISWRETSEPALAG